MNYIAPSPASIPDNKQRSTINDINPHNGKVVAYHFRDVPPNPDFPFVQTGNPWDAMYFKFKEAVKGLGLSRLLSDPHQHELRDWLNRQVLNRRHLEEDQFRKLDALGVIWDAPASRDHAWEIMFSRLEAFNEEYGHSQVPYQWPVDRQLALWVLRQRKLYSQNKILAYRKQLLNNIEFIWQAKEQYNRQWNYYYQELLAFYKEHGHTSVPGRKKELVSWMERQRLQRKRNLLSQEREARLNQINFIWDFTGIKEQGWEDRYGELREFNETHGHSFVPVKYQENKSLGMWISLQRKLEKNGTLSQEKVKKLDKLNFVWSRDTIKKSESEFDSLWTKHFEKLKAYKKQHGTCQVSLKSDRVLQNWTVWQRKLYYQGKLSDKRIDELNKISFPWNINEGYWEKMYDLLVVFHKKFGHSSVPSQWTENPRLGAWVYRVKADKHKLCSEQIELLNSLDFKWGIKKHVVVAWPFMYRRLLAFKQEHGHTRVPVKWEKDTKLGKWVSRMRNESMKISPARRMLLEAIGFEWRRFNPKGV